LWSGGCCLTVKFCVNNKCISFLDPCQAPRSNT
jgi:hypothetical protein